jgi:hypothetical protein
MIKPVDHKYSDIESFEDFRVEKERLVFRSKLIEARMSLSCLEFKKSLSVSNMFLSFTKEHILPKVSDFLSHLLEKIDKEAL